MRLRGGFSCSVACTIAAIFSAGIDGLRPRPGRITPISAKPASANRERQERTVTAVTPNCSAIRVFASPLAANSSACARRTCWCGALEDLANTPNIAL